MYKKINDLKNSKYKKLNKSSKENDLQSRLYDKRYICVSKKWIRWAKNYMNRVLRRRAKQKIKGEKYSDN